MNKLASIVVGLTIFALSALAVAYGLYGLLLLFIVNHASPNR